MAHFLKELPKFEFSFSSLESPNHLLSRSKSNGHFAIISYDRTALV